MEDPNAIFFPQSWYARLGSAGLPKDTAEPGRSLNSFGYTAENRYVHLASEDKHKDYYMYFFVRFKMNLHWKVSTCIWYMTTTLSVRL